MTNRIFFFVMSFMTSLTTAFAQEIAKAPPPFGLTWGMSQADVKRMGVLLECKQNEPFTFCRTASLPKNLSNVEYYQLLFSADNKLVKTRYVSNHFTNDAFGTEGKVEYERVKKTLSKKYGPPENTEIIGLRLYKDRDEFYQCLAYDGCGGWFSFWEFPDESIIVLKLSGLKRGTGYMSITYETSNFGAAIDNHKEQDESVL